MKTRNVLTVVTIAVVLMLAAPGAQAATNTWTNPVSGNWNDAANWDAFPANDGTADLIFTTAVTATITNDWAINNISYTGVAANLYVGGTTARTLDISGFVQGNASRWFYFQSPKVRFTAANHDLTGGNIYFNGSEITTSAGASTLHVKLPDWRYVQFAGSAKTTGNVTWSMEGGQFAIYTADMNAALGTNKILVAGTGGQRYIGVYGNTASNHEYWTAPIEIDEATIGSGNGRIPLGLIFSRGSSDSDTVITHVQGKWTTKGGVAFTNTSGIGTFALYGKNDDEKARNYYEADNSGLKGSTVPTDNAWSGDLSVNSGTHVINAPHAFGTNNSFFINLSDQSGGVTAARNMALLATSGNNVSGVVRIYGGSVVINGGVTNRQHATVGLEGTGSVVFSGKILLALWPDIGATSRVADAYLTAPAGGTAIFSGDIKESTVAGTTLAPKVFVTGGGTVVMEGILNYTGKTTVQSNTTFKLDGLNNSSEIEVLAGSTLMGGGQTLVNVIIGGDLAPGGSIGTFTANGDVDFSTGSTLTIELGPGDTCDLLSVTGDLDITGATLRLVGSDIGTFTIASYGTLTGANFLSIDTTGLTGGVSFDTIDYTTDNQISLTVIPEPASILLLASGLVAAYKLRRRA